MISAAAKSFGAIDAPASPDAWQWAFSLDWCADGARRAMPNAVAGGLSVWFQGFLFERDIAGIAGAQAESDAAFVLSGYQRLGIDVFGALRGKFAVAISDEAQGRVLVARDQMGSYPVFYRERHGVVTFAASTLPLASLDRTPLRFNRPALADAVCRRFPYIEETFFEDVTRLAGGTFATIRDGRLVVTRYWDPLPVDRPIDWLTEKDLGLVEAARRRAIRRCTGVGPSAILLSGGLDSVSIAAAAADDAREQGTLAPLALSLGFSESGAIDERAIQTTVASTLGLDHDLIDFRDIAGGTDLLDRALAMNRQSSSPVIAPWSPVYSTLVQRGRELGRSVVLTGLGGDEFFSASAYVGADLLMQGDVRGAARSVQMQADYYGAAKPNYWRGAVRPALAAMAGRIGGARWDRRRVRRLVGTDPSWVAPDPDLRRQCIRRAGRAFIVRSWPHGLAPSDARSSIVDHPLISNTAEEYHEQGAGLGMVFLSPYFDPDLVGLLLRTPALLLSTGRAVKGLLRGPLARRFPSCGFDRQRKTAATDFVRSTLFDDGHVERLLASNFEFLSKIGVVDGRRAAAAARTATKEIRSASQIWGLFSLEAWVAARHQYGFYHPMRVAS